MDIIPFNYIYYGYNGDCYLHSCTLNSPRAAVHLLVGCDLDCGAKKCKDFKPKQTQS